METTLQSIEAPSLVSASVVSAKHVSATTAGTKQTPGSVYAFVPSHGEANAGEVVKELCRSLSQDLGRSVLLADFYSRGFPVWGTPEAPQRLDRQTWGAFLTPGSPFDTLETREAHPREIQRLLERARSQYGVTCADLTDAKQVAVLEMLRAADWIFVVSGSDVASLEMARFKAAWLRSIDLETNSCLLLKPVPGGMSIPEAEQITGLPVCALVDHTEELNQLATWLAVPRN